MRSHKLARNIYDKFRMLLIILVSSMVSLHAEGFTLTGTVVDGTGSPLEGVAVKLLYQGITATTNSSGCYTIKGQTIAAVSPVNSASVANLVSVFRNQLQLTITESGSAQASFYSLQGKLLLNNAFTGRTGDVKSLDLKTLPQGIYTYSITSGSNISRGKLVHSGQSYYLSSVKNSIKGVNGEHGARSTASVVDILLFSKDGYVSKSVKVESLNGVVDISLTASTALEEISGKFSDRDLEQNADLSDAKFYTLTSGHDITITQKGVYVFSGRATDVSIIVDAPDSMNVQLVLDGVDVTNSDAPVVYVKSANKVFITTSESSTNNMKFTGAAVLEVDGDDTTSLDGVIFGKDDLVLNGLGTLNVVSEQTHGIVTKDDLKITGGTVTITAAYTGLKANDSFRMASGVITVNAGTDALHIENNGNDTLGYVYISGGNLTIDANDEGIMSSSYVQIKDGTVTVKSSNNAIKGAYIEINDGTLDIVATTITEGTETKGGHGLDASDSISITGGEIDIDVEADGIHAENSGNTAVGFIRISGGSLDIEAGDEGIMASKCVQVDSGTVNITKSNKGIDGSYIEINNGTLDITSSGHGIKAIDSIHVAGGSITINSEADCIHAENAENTNTGSISISGGTIILNAKDDGIRATTVVQIDGGTIDVKSSTEGIEGTYILINDGDITVKSTDDGINATKKSNVHSVLIEVTGGNINVTVSGRDVDGFDANGSITLSGGTIYVTYPTQGGPSGAFDADNGITLTGATVYVNGTKTTNLGGGGFGRF